MRLIDADAEIKKIEEEIKRSYKAIDRWRSGRMPGSSLYDIDTKIRQIKNNIMDCKREIRMLKSYTTAYDVNQVLKRLEKAEKECREEVQEFERKEMYNASKARHIEARCYSNAVEIVKGGRKDGNNAADRT